MANHSAGIVTIGNELLNGDVINTNASWLGQILRGIGIPCETVLTVSDDMESILSAVNYLWDNHDLVIVTGGLGPTRDDVTKSALLHFFEDQPVRDENVLAHVTEYFRKRGRPVSEVNRQQADIPSRARIMFNDLGTAPGLLMEKDDRILAAMPGVPYELKHITEKRLIPLLEQRWEKKERRISQKYYRTTGIGESDLSERVLGGLEKVIPDTVDIAFLPHPSGVDIRITEINGSSQAAFSDFCEWIQQKASLFIFSDDYHETLGRNLVTLLADSGKTLSFAESCSGGFLASSLTDVPGSSRCFRGSVIAYDNEVKINTLGVSSDAIEEHGAVSAPVALEMAKCAGKLMRTDYAISTTGVAGPGGGTRDKPVGTIWIGFWAGDVEHFACRFHFTTERLVNKERSFAAAMDLLRRNIRGLPGYPYQPEVVRP
ncbi:CinA family nicotinamide mononucleotide deamidase-related protein [Natronogracilivirga saccharolytica]|uniref:CinA-like protein n=1 Tax=Natronogracilivirga saccharolytica TaxID=2812953 RepID=A0A8J7UVH8_9BACT|nr:CinA family nicotinamide mononucleotide deamidase-related protein [Natronogracilivirga saccharolytica]MBP3191184.1 CinA family nicotinamide mononucleotide deamidase-related protein [Natronogracilivirga saccharolytica]